MSAILAHQQSLFLTAFQNMQAGLDNPMTAQLYNAYIAHPQFQAFVENNPRPDIDLAGAEPVQGPFSADVDLDDNLVNMMADEIYTNIEQGYGSALTDLADDPQLTPEQLQTFWNIDANLSNQAANDAFAQEQYTYFVANPNYTSFFEQYVQVNGLENSEGIEAIRADVYQRHEQAVQSLETNYDLVVAGMAQDIYSIAQNSHYEALGESYTQVAEQTLFSGLEAAQPRPYDPNGSDIVTSDWVDPATIPDTRIANAFDAVEGQPEDPELAAALAERINSPEPLVAQADEAVTPPPVSIDRDALDTYFDDHNSIFGTTMFWHNFEHSAEHTALPDILDGMDVASGNHPQMAAFTATLREDETLGTAFHEKLKAEGEALLTSTETYLASTPDMTPEQSYAFLGVDLPGAEPEIAVAEADAAPEAEGNGFDPLAAIVPGANAAELDPGEIQLAAVDPTAVIPDIAPDATIVLPEVTGSQFTAAQNELFMDVFDNFRAKAQGEIDAGLGETELQDQLAAFQNNPLYDDYMGPIAEAYGRPDLMEGIPPAPANEGAVQVAEDAYTLIGQEDAAYLSAFGLGDDPISPTLPADTLNAHLASIQTSLGGVAATDGALSMDEYILSDPRMADIVRQGESLAAVTGTEAIVTEEAALAGQEVARDNLFHTDDAVIPSAPQIALNDQHLDDAADAEAQIAAISSDADEVAPPAVEVAAIDPNAGLPEEAAPSTEEELAALQTDYANVGGYTFEEPALGASEEGMLNDIIRQDADSIVVPSLTAEQRYAIADDGIDNDNVTVLDPIIVTADAEPAAPEVPTEHIYQIQPGDNLWKIMQEQYGITNHTDIMNAYGQVAELNGIPDVDLIYAGEEMTLPHSIELANGNSYTFGGAEEAAPAETDISFENHEFDESGGADMRERFGLEAPDGGPDEVDMAAIPVDPALRNQLGLG